MGMGQMMADMMGAAQDDPTAKLEKLKGMFDKGLIDQK